MKTHKNTNDFIEYYGKHKISPVKQDLSDIQLHYAKREKLCRQLGIPGIAFEGKKVLEVGPGSGYNTLFFFSQGGHCSLVEPNETGVLEMKRLFEEYNIPEAQYRILESTIEEMDIQEQYDIVIAEGFLHSIQNSEEIIRKLSKAVKDGGVIVITCMDVFSMFVEQMKRLVCHVLIKEIPEYEAQVKYCVDFFERQMKYASGMSRSVADWVRDDMLNPVFNSETILSMDKALEVFEPEFSLLGSSQRIFTDYSWYKDLKYDERKNLLYQYKIKRHNFLFTGLEESILSEADSEFLEENISRIRKDAIAYEKENADEYLVSVEERLCSIRFVMQKIDKMCVEFVDEVIEILKTLRVGQAVEFEKYGTFYKAVGRTQQYLSMVKDKNIKNAVNDR